MLYRKHAKLKTHSPHPQFILDDESLIYRYLSFKETIEARVEDYENNKSTEERKRLFKRWNDSCTGIVYKGSTTKFKVVPSCNQLITINKDFREESIAVDYDAIRRNRVRPSCWKIYCTSYQR